VLSLLAAHQGYNTRTPQAFERAFVTENISMSVAQLEARRKRITSPREAENELLIRFSKTTLSADDHYRLRDLVAQDLDWQRITLIALYRHGTFALLGKHLKAIAPELMNHPFVEAMEHRRAYLAVQNVQFAHELIELSKSLNARGIQVIPYKGPVLAVQAYGDLSLRPCLDLDIIVARSQVADVQRALGEFGYRPANENWSMEFMCSNLFKRLTYENTFIRQAQHRTQPNYMVDVHWEVAPPHTLSFDFDYLLSNCIEVELCGQKIRSLRPELLLVVLCAHGTKHRWQEMKWLVDVVEIIRRSPGLDWDEVYKIAGRQGISRKIDLALLIGARAMQSELPQSIISRIQKEGYLNSLCERIVLSWTYDLLMSDNLKSYWAVEMHTCDSAAKRWTFITNELFQPTVSTYLEFPLPESLFPMYHVIQPVRTVFNSIAKQLKNQIFQLDP
jgi:hypothetical protein